MVCCANESLLELQLTKMEAGEEETDDDKSAKWGVRGDEYPAAREYDCFPKQIKSPHFILPERPPLSGRQALLKGI